MMTQRMDRFLSLKLSVLLILLLLTNLGDKGDGYDVLESICQCILEEQANSTSKIMFTPLTARGGSLKATDWRRAIAA